MSIPVEKSSLTSIFNEQDLPSGSALLAIPSAHLCPKCKDFKALTKLNREEEAQCKQEAALDESDQNENLRGTESTDTIVAIPQDSQENDPSRFRFVSDVLNNMTLEIKSIESIHELKPKKEEKILIEPEQSQRNTAVENALRSSDRKRLSYFEDEGFKMYDLNIVTSLTDLDTLKYKSDKESPKIENLSNEPQNFNHEVVNAGKNVGNKDQSTENQEFDNSKDPEQLNKALTFNESYQPTFNMQPEILNIKSKPLHGQQFVFGSGKSNRKNEVKDPAVKESLDLLKRSIESLKKREFGNFADNILQSVTKLSLEKSQQFKEVKNKFSEAEIDEKLQNTEFKDIEISLMHIEGMLEEILSNEQSVQADDSEKRYVIVIQKLCDVLSLLFEQFRDKIELPAKISDNEAMDPNVQSTSPEIETKVSIKLDIADPINQEVPTNEEIATKENETSKTVDVTANGKKICKCFSMNNELDKQSDEPVYKNDTEIKTAKSVDFDVLEEQVEVPLKTFSSLSSTKISDSNLRKVQNVDDLSNTESSTNLKSQSFVRFKGIDEHHIKTSVIQVSSIPSMITRHYHTDDLKQALLTESMHSIKGESMSKAVIEDLNDDGFQNLPKVPSTALSEASSSEWIDENTSFIKLHDQKVEVEAEPKLEDKAAKPDALPILPLESLCSILNEPQLSALEDPQPLSLKHTDPQPAVSPQDDPQPLNAITSSEPQPSTSAQSEPPAKKQTRFSGCKNFVKRLISNTLLRKKDRN
ncbi:uncharacterized protein [Chironomus tepperi]|uniref:uncharacterized protein n=1 Tax=Chironomus tepperi TaxID=113505 RepID=UPI00391FAB81